MPAPMKTHPHEARDTAIGTTVPPAPCTTDAGGGNTGSTRNGVTAVTRNSDKLGKVAPVTALQSYAHRATKLPPPRGATERMSSLALRDAIYERSLLLSDKFRVIRTIDIAAACFPERPFKAALTAAQRAVRGMVKRGLLRRYRTDGFQTVYGLTQRGFDWLPDLGHDAASSVRRVSDMTNPEHRLWAQFLVICAWARGLDAVTEAELLQRLSATASAGTTKPTLGKGGDTV